MELPKRVTLLPDGSYIWAAPVDRETEKAGNRLGLWLSLGIDGLVVAVNLIVCLCAGNRTGLWIGLGCGLVVLLIAFGVYYGIDRLPGPRYQKYRLYDTGLHFGSGRTGSSVRLQDVRAMTVRKDVILLRIKRLDYRVYVPQEDMGFVAGYLKSRLPLEAEVRTE